MVGRQSLGALCAVLAGAQSVLASGAGLEARNYCEPVTVTAFCTVSVLEKITALVHSTVTVTGTVTGAGSVVTDTVSASASTTTVPYTSYLTKSVYNNVTTSIYSNVTTSVYSNVSVTVTATTTESASSSSTPVSVSASASSSAPASSSSAPSSASSSASSTAALPTACGNTGLDFAYYTHNYYNGDDTYTSVDVQAFKTKTPELVNTTSYMGLDFQQTGDETNYGLGPIYNSEGDYQWRYFALNHHAYLFAIEAGTYTVSGFDVDDALWVWTGDNAYSGWTRENANMAAVFDNGVVDNTYTFEAEAGDYVPLRFLFVQAQGVASFDFTMTSPSGQVLVSGDSLDSPYIFRYSCDLITAPLFPAFGAEL